MKLEHIERVRLVEGLDRDASRTYRLWESAGQVLKEFQLDQKQIDQLFAQIEQDVTATGGNRTALGKGIDVTTKAGAAVKKAYDDLVSQVQNSGPIKNVDAMYDQAAEKLKQATGGDQGVMQYVQKYRDFAKKHPIAQGIIYSVLIAAAGLSGAGLGGAAALGLFKMTDKLLQGEKFSTAVGKGAMTGAMAYGTSHLLHGGDLPSDPNAPGYQVGADGPADIGNQSFAPPPETSQNFGLTPGGVDPNATQNAIDTATKTATDVVHAGAKSAAVDSAKQLATKSSDAAQLAADQATGGVTDIDTLKQGVAAGSDAAQAATNTDAASALASHSAAGADTATNAVGTAANATGEVTMQTAIDAAHSATSRLADAAPGSMGKSAAEQMLQQDTSNAVMAAIKNGTLGSPTDLNFTSRVSDFVNNYVADKAHLVKDVSGKAIGGTFKDMIRSSTVDQALAAASGPGAHEFVRGALVKEYIDKDSTVRHWALNESLGRPRGGIRLTEAGVNRVIELATKQAVNEGIMDTIKGAAGKAGAALAQTGKNLTNKVTADKLKKAWINAGSPTDSDDLHNILTGVGGLSPDIVDKAYAALKIPSMTSTPAANADAAKGPPAAGTSQFVKDLVAGYMALTPAERSEIMKELDVAIDVSSNSNLVKGMNESKRRKKKAVR